MVFIYIITNNINKKVYIGQAKNVKRRWTTHLYYAKTNRGNSIIHKAIRSYGAENFKYIVLEIVSDKKEANEKEIYYIEKYKSTCPENGYNITKGGLGHVGVFGERHPMFGKKRPDLVELNKKRTGIPLSENHIKKITKKGQKHSEQAKIKMSEGKKKSWASDTYKDVDWVAAKKKQFETNPKNGEKHPMAKLKENDVISIRNEYVRGVISMQTIADKYNVTQGLINSVLKRKVWNNI
jgi:group I intron endonuclease